MSVMKSISPTNTGGIVVELHVSRCYLTHTVTATVPTWDLKSAVNGINVNSWTKCRFENSGNYSIHIESTVAGYCQDNYIADCNFEHCLGGEVRLLSCRNTTIERCAGYDGGTYTKDRYYVGKSTSGSSSLSTSFRHVTRRAPGALGAGIFDIHAIGSQSGRVNVEFCNGAIDLGSVSGVNLYGLDATSPAAVVTGLQEGTIQLEAGLVRGQRLATYGTAGGGYVEFNARQSATPATPAAGGVRLFTRTVTGALELCVVDDTGTVRKVTLT
jgi:hypothetical protein